MAGAGKQIHTLLKRVFTGVIQLFKRSHKRVKARA
jgi:hypothetical protein